MPKPAPGLLGLTVRVVKDVRVRVTKVVTSSSVAVEAGHVMFGQKTEDAPGPIGPTAPVPVTKLGAVPVHDWREEDVALPRTDDTTPAVPVNEAQGQGEAVEVVLSHGAWVVAVLMGSTRAVELIKAEQGAWTVTVLVAFQTGRWTVTVRTSVAVTVVATQGLMG